MFESVRLYINDVPITHSPNDYPFKAYISNCLTYSSIVKASQLATQGYYGDVFHHMGPVAENSGFTERNQLFREDEKTNTAYKSDGTRLFGRLFLDLVSCQTGLPPGTKICIELEKSENSFVILSQKTDTEKYKLKLNECNFYVPIAQLSSSVYNELSSILTTKSVGIHYRKVKV